MLLDRGADGLIELVDIIGDEVCQVIIFGMFSTLLLRSELRAIGWQRFNGEPFGVLGEKQLGSSTTWTR